MSKHFFSLKVVMVHIKYTVILNLALKTSGYAFNYDTQCELRGRRNWIYVW